MIAWRIWYARNEVTHDKELPVIEGSWRFICSYMNSLENIMQATPEQIIKGKQAMGVVAVNKQVAQPRVQEVWSRPPDGELKLNVDGSFISQFGEGGLGWSFGVMMVRWSSQPRGICTCAHPHWRRSCRLAWKGSALHWI